MAFFRVVYAGSDISRGDDSNPYTVNNLNATVPNESTPEQLVIATTVGKKVTGTVTITPTGGTSARWALSTNGTTWATWGASITLTNLDATGKTIWVKAKAISTDARGTDDTVNLRVSGLISNA